MYLGINQLTSFTWKGCPPSLETIYLNGNQLTSFSWEGCPKSLEIIYLNGNQLTSFSWEGCPESLKIINLNSNQLRSFSWEGCSESLKIIHLNLDLFIELKYTLEQYKAKMKIWRAYLRHYTRRKAAAVKISRATHNWVWKPICKDGTLGIRLRLNLQEDAQHLKND